MFPISSDLVPEEEKLRHYEVLSTYADCLSKGPWDLGAAKIRSTQALQSQFRYRREEFPFTKGRKCAAKWMKCSKERL